MLFIKKSTLIAIADAVRSKAGSTDKIKTSDLPSAIEALEFKFPETVLLIDDEGHEVAATYLEEEVIFTATENDIREGTVAMTDTGVTTGTKVIPAYHTNGGYCLIPSGSEFKISSLVKLNCYEYTKLQVIICPYAGSIAGSVAAEKVAIDSNVYEANSTTAISTVVSDSENKAINLGIKNESESLYLLRYITYKEIY